MDRASSKIRGRRALLGTNEDSFFRSSSDDPARTLGTCSEHPASRIAVTDDAARLSRRGTRDRIVRQSAQPPILTIVEMAKRVAGICSAQVAPSHPATSLR